MMMMTPKAFFYSRRQDPSSSSFTPSSTARSSSKKRDERPSRDNKSNPAKYPSNAALTSQPSVSTMPKRKESSDSPPPNRSSTTMTNTVARPNTPTSALQIPVKLKQETTHISKSRHHADSHRRQSGTSQRRRDAPSPNAIPSSVAALLAGTNIPPPSKRGSPRQRQPSNESRMTVDSIVPRSQVSEKELSQELSFSPFSRSPMDLLLSPPEDSLDEDMSIFSESCVTSALSTRAGSLESLPSLGDSLGTSAFPSGDSPFTPRKYRLPRRSLEPVSSPPGEPPAVHPLYDDPNIEVQQVEFKVFDSSPVRPRKEATTVFMPLKSAFASNLTASLRALRSAARSISSFTASSVPPQDLLTRSILTIDPHVPFTDERRPPMLEEEPSDAMRRYLNPTDNARLELRATMSATSTRSYTASIQMQTYKVQRSRGAPATASRVAAPPPPPKTTAPLTFPPGPRQREIRENPDFIRIAVLEHLMRKRGKFDNQQEGHARWLLPPRKSSAKPYEIGSDGVPARWTSTSQDVF